MRIKVTEGPVRENVKLFLEILRRANSKAHRHLPPKSLFKAWVNRETGQFFVQEAALESSFFENNEWKPVEISCVYDPDKGEVCLLIEETAKESFHCDDLTPLAFSIMRDTMKILNEVFRRLKGPSDLETKMAVATKLEIDVAESNKNILMECWHPLDRFQAEAILWDEPVGTYLFRKDSYAKILEEQLERSLGKKVKCFTLTFSQATLLKFSDFTLVHIEGYWLIYNDDPSLDQKRFTDLFDLLETLQGVLRHPLINHDWDGRIIV